MGVVLYIMLAGRAPFPGKDNNEILTNVVSGVFSFNFPVFGKISDLCKDFITKLLEKDVNKRLSASEALMHPWISTHPEEGHKELGFEVEVEVFEDMEEFFESSSLKKTTLSLLASCMPEESVEDLRQEFINLDKDDDGVLTFDELKEGAGKLGLPINLEHLQKVFEIMDTNHNGKIDYNEFLAGCMHEHTYMNKARLRRAFQFFDRDNSGTISKTELRQCLGDNDLMLTEQELEKLIDEVDENHDGEVDWNEFMKMMQSHHHKHFS